MIKYCLLFLISFTSCTTSTENRYPVWEERCLFKGTEYERCHSIPSEVHRK